MTRGRLFLILGCMFASKTSELLKRLKTAKLKNKKCLLVKFNRDTRYSATQVATHDQVMHPAVLCGEELEEIYAQCQQADAIFIDEGNAFKDIDVVCERLVNEGKTVMVAALDGSSFRKPFGKIPELMALADDYRKLKAVCLRCRDKKAIFTGHKGEQFTVEDWGGSEKYVPLCRDCWHAHEATKKAAVVPDGGMFSITL